KVTSERTSDLSCQRTLGWNIKPSAPPRLPPLPARMALSMRDQYSRGSEPSPQYGSSGAGIAGTPLGTLNQTRFHSWAYCSGVISCACGQLSRLFGSSPITHAKTPVEFRMVPIAALAKAAYWSG